MSIFRTFCLANIGQEKVFYKILEQKNAFLAYKNKKFKMSKIWHFSKGVNPLFWSKNGHFSTLFFLGNIRQENVFCDIVERKNVFLGYKNNKFSRAKNLNFSKGVTRGFGPKMTVVPPFFLGNIVQENIFDEIVEQNNAFLGYKNKQFRKSKNWHFSKGVKSNFTVTQVKCS